MLSKMTTSDYNRDLSIDLNLLPSELISLVIVLRDALAKYGVRVVHEQIVEGQGAPGSHIGTLISLVKRVDAARHGRRTWNADWRDAERHRTHLEK